MNADRTGPAIPLALWAHQLRSLAHHALPDLDPVAPLDARIRFIADFRDEMGHRRDTDPPLLGRLLHAAPDRPDRQPHPDAALWWALHDAESDPRTLIAGEGGPLVPELRRLGIEAWSQAELCALHALSWHALRPDSHDLAERLDAAAHWHLAELQPDNATNRPWAVHVFAELAERTGNHDAHAHAGALVHNSLVTLGRPDRLSAVIMLDAAEWLDARAQTV